MRVLILIFSIAASLGFSGCAHKIGESTAALVARANNTASTQADRAHAVFTLFARYVRPGSSATDVRRVLPDTAWLRETHLYGIRALAGWIPIGTSFDDTAFCIQLFPADAKKEWSPWVIYFRLSGELRDEDAMAFLRGERVAGDPKLVEFALCFPSRREAVQGPFHAAGESRRRIEHFSHEGFHAYDL